MNFWVNQSMYNILLKIFCYLIFVLFITACNGFFEKDNTPEPAPLVYMTPEIQPVQGWSTRAGTGTGDDYLKMGFSVSDHAIFTTSIKGTVTSISQDKGLQNWQMNTDFPITTGPGIGDDLVVIGGRRGEILALQQNTGQIVWKTNLPSQAFAKPAIKNNIVVIKSIDGYLRALSTKDGHLIWSFQQIEPNLILRSASNPFISNQNLFVGFANGNLTKLNLSDGQPIWTQALAIPQGPFAIQRMIDIDADPILFEQHIYAATYQGKINSLDWTTGKIFWSHNISSYTGMIADNHAIYITDAKSHVWSFDVSSGLVNWRQDKLEARVITAPTIQDNYIVVGDAQGYLHWLNKRDGRIAARKYVGSMYTAPIVKNGVLYALTNSG